MCPIMTSHFTGTTRKKMESRKAASEEVRLQTTAKNRQRGCRRDVRWQTVRGVLNKAIDTATNHSTTYDFLLAIHSNHGPIPCRFLQTAILVENLIFSHLLVFNDLRNFVKAVGLNKTRMLSYKRSNTAQRYLHSFRGVLKSDGS